MSETRYYHLQSQPVEQALPLLLGKTLERGWRALVMAGFSDRIEPLTDHLWTYDVGSFLPHGSAKDGNASDQPIWLTSEDENLNGANVLFLIEQAESESLGNFELVCRLFDGSDEAAVKKARIAWKAEKEAGRSLTYWQQTEQGSWSKVAEANNSEQ